jgi:hypothetical protein
VKPPRGKSPTRQSRYGDGAPWGILAKESKIVTIRNLPGTSPVVCGFIAITISSKTGMDAGVKED